MTIELDGYTSLLLLIMESSNLALPDGCTEPSKMIVCPENKTKQNNSFNHSADR